MSKTNPLCRVCGVALNSENWCPSGARKRDYICNTCTNRKNREWYHENLKIARAQKTRANRRKGMASMVENRGCTAFLGVYVAEEVLSNVFKNVERMPHNNKGFDFRCGQGYEIDVKASCMRLDRHWSYAIGYNTIADYFLCIAFDDRDNLNPLHLWLIPGKAVNHLSLLTISLTTIKKWDKYRLDINQVVTCCNTMKK